MPIQISLSSTLWRIATVWCALNNFLTIVTTCIPIMIPFHNKKAWGSYELSSVRVRNILKCGILHLIVCRTSRTNRPVIYLATSHLYIHMWTIKSNNETYPLGPSRRFYRIYSGRIQNFLFYFVVPFSPSFQALDFLHCDCLPSSWFVSPVFPSLMYK